MIPLLFPHMPKIHVKMKNFPLYLYVGLVGCVLNEKQEIWNISSTQNWKISVREQPTPQQPQISVIVQQLFGECIYFRLLFSNDGLFMRKYFHCHHIPLIFIIISVIVICLLASLATNEEGCEDIYKILSSVKENTERKQPGSIFLPTNTQFSVYAMQINRINEIESHDTHVPENENWCCEKTGESHVNSDKKRRKKMRRIWRNSQGKTKRWGKIEKICSIFVFFLCLLCFNFEARGANFVEIKLSMLPAFIRFSEDIRNCCWCCCCCCCNAIIASLISSTLCWSR